MAGSGMQQVRLDVQMLGGFSLSVCGKSLSDKTERSRQLISLLAFLLIKRFDYTSQERLMEILWPDDESENPANALKNLIYRLRRHLSGNEALQNADCIILSGGTYTWNKALVCSVDAEEMDRLYRAAQESKDPADDKIKLYLQAISLYRGRFLADLGHEEWVTPLATYYQNIYLNCIYEAVKLLSHTGNYQEIVRICEQATDLEPYEEALHEILLQAYIKLEKNKKALDYYEYISRKFYSNLGVRLSPALQDIHKELAGRLNLVETDLGLIKEELVELNGEQGAFLCDYGIFKHLYRLEVRASERSGQPFFICLMTLEQSKRSMPQGDTMLKAMESLKNILLGSLRKGDVVTRFSATQFIMMLPATTYKNGEKVLERIKGRFNKVKRNPGIRLTVSLEPVFTGM